jgi:hypothetical protein
MPRRKSALSKTAIQVGSVAASMVMVSAAWFGTARGIIREHWAALLLILGLIVLSRITSILHRRRLETGRDKVQEYLSIANECDKNARLTRFPKRWPFRALVRLCGGSETRAAALGFLISMALCVGTEWAEIDGLISSTISTVLFLLALLVGYVLCLPAWAGRAEREALKYRSLAEQEFDNRTAHLTNRGKA